MSEEFQTEKPWWQSRTVIGALVAVLASVVGGLDAAMQTQLTDIILSLVATVGALAALVGRFTAKKRLKLK
jgi:hypothetical protein